MQRSWTMDGHKRRHPARVRDGLNLACDLLGVLGQSKALRAVDAQVHEEEPEDDNRHPTYHGVVPDEGYDPDILIVSLVRGSDEPAESPGCWFLRVPSRRDGGAASGRTGPPI